MNVILSLMLALMPAASPQENSSVSIKELRNASAVVLIDNRSLHLSTYPWRDFMPGAWEGGSSPLMIGLKVISADKKPLPSGLRMDRAWVLFGEQIWEVPEFNFKGRIAGQQKDSWIKCPASPVCEISVRGGPRWDPGVYVDVVVRLTDSEGRQHFLQAPNQLVIATS